MERKRLTNEQDIIKACIKGESWAQKAIFDQYAPTMLSVCVRYVSDYETARDILQDGFVRLFSKIETFSGTGAFGGWARRIFVTTALEHLRRNDALKNADSIDDFHNHFENNEVNVIDQISADDLMQCIAELPDGYKAVFNMFAIEGYSHAEIAEMLGINDITSRTQYMRARKMLQKKIELLIGEDYAKQYRK